MASTRRCSSTYTIIVFLAALLGLISCSMNRDIAQNNASQTSPIGVYTEMLTREGSDLIEKCKYCGRFIKVGEIHRNAAAIVDVQVKMGLDERNIPYLENGRDQEKFLHLYIFKFDERRGGSGSVEKPASAGFHMHLYDRGIVKHVFVFDEEQRPLLENIFALGKFLRRGMKWITVDKLSEEGVEKGLDWVAEELASSRHRQPEAIQNESLLQSR
jgi:hypothetical protein